MKNKSQGNKKEKMKKEIKKRSEILNRKILIIGILLLLIFLLLVNAQGGGRNGQDSETLQSELNNLTSELTSQGYSWLINYSIDNERADIVVSKKDDNSEIARFTNITAENWYKVYLTELNETESYDVFDLKIIINKINEFTSIIAGIVFDYIVDPISSIIFVAPTPANATSTSNTSIIVNVSIFEQSGYGLSEVKWNWNTTNYTLYDNSLVLMMNMDNLSALGENDTYVVDVSNYSNNGTVVGGAKVNTSGRYGGAFTFDGVDDYVNAGNASSLAPTETMTYGAWFNPAQILAASDYRLILMKANSSNSGYWLYIYNINGKIRAIATIRTNTVPDIYGVTNISQINQWYHAAVTYNGSLTSLYLNGILENTSAQTGSIIPASLYGLTIGKRSDLNSQFFNGSIDSVLIFNRSLSASEVYQIYASNLQKYNSTQWYLYVNQSKNATTGLDYATYTYFASAKNYSGSENKTETRSIEIANSPSGKKFIITNKSGDNVASFDDKGDIYLKGTASQSQSSLSPTANSFIVQNSTGTVISYINNSGYMFMLGTYTESSDLSGLTSSNLEIRNSTNNLVAFFDNLGNLKLKGNLAENYGAP